MFFEIFLENRLGIMGTALLNNDCSAGHPAGADY